MANAVYNLLFKRTSAFLCCGIIFAFGLETFINVTSDQIYNSVNRGLLWEHIKDNYKKAGQ